MTSQKSTATHSEEQMECGDVDSLIRAILRERGRLYKDPSSLHEHADLFKEGMTSHANVNVMLALEESFGIEFRTEMVRRSTFRSISSIKDAVRELQAK